MLYRYFISLLICLQAAHVYSQDSLRYNTKWHISTSFGASAALQPFFKGEVTDPLIGFDDRTFTWQVLSLSYFFKKHWGVAFNFRLGFTQQKGDKINDQFNQLMQAQYGNSYYVNSLAGDIYNIESDLEGKIADGYLGVVYRQEWSRFFIYPKLAIGITSLSCARGQVDLKQKNANDVYQVFYKNTGGSDFFTIAASALTGYKLSKKIFLHIEPLGTFYKARFNYTKTTTNINSRESTEEVIPYKRNVFSVSLSAGLTYVIN
jgi:hypothetical protein